MNLGEIVVSHPRISAQDKAVKARAIMRKNNIRALPVFENTELVGIITRSDLIKITSTKSNIPVGGLLWKPLVKMDSNADILEATRIMLEQKIKQVAVFENGNYIGLVRDIDIMKALIQANARPKKKYVKDVMSKKPKSFSTGDSIDKVWFALKEHSGFPVMDKKEVVGIITSKEMLDSKKARLSRDSKGVKKHAEVGHIMRIVRGEKGRFLLKPNTEITEAMRNLLDLDVSVLPVVNGKLAGVVTKKDLLKGYLR